MNKLIRLISALVLILTGCQPSVRLQQVSESGFGAFEADLAIVDSDTLAVAWYDTRHGQGEIYLRLLGSDLEFKSQEIRITDTSSESYEPDVVAHQGKLAITWYEVDAEGSGSVWLGLWSGDGNLLGKRRLSRSVDNARIPVMESVGNHLFVAWLQESQLNANESAIEIVSAWIDPEKLEAVVPFHVSTASDTTWNINLSSVDLEEPAEVLIAFDAEFETAASELYLARVVNESVRVNRISSDDGYASKYPDIVWQSGSLALTWFDNVFANNEVFLSMGALENYFSDSTADRMELAARRVSSTEGDSIGAYLALGNEFVSVAWSDNESDRYQIYMQSFAQDLKPMGDKREITVSQADSYIPSIVRQKDSVYLAWNELFVSAHDSPNNLSRSEIFVSVVAELP